MEWIVRWFTTYNFDFPNVHFLRSSIRRTFRFSPCSLCIQFWRWLKVTENRFWYFCYWHLCFVFWPTLEVHVIRTGHKWHFEYSTKLQTPIKPFCLLHTNKITRERKKKKEKGKRKRKRKERKTDRKKRESDRLRSMGELERERERESCAD